MHCRSRKVRLSQRLEAAAAGRPPQNKHAGCMRPAPGRPALSGRPGRGVKGSPPAGGEFFIFTLTVAPFLSVSDTACPARCPAFVPLSPRNLHVLPEPSGWPAVPSL